MMICVFRFRQSMPRKNARIFAAAHVRFRVASCWERMYRCLLSIDRPIDFALIIIEESRLRAEEQRSVRYLSVFD
jgi:hypothetical protein